MISNSPCRRERGISLVELMIGLALAMMSTIAALYAYRSSVSNAVSTRQIATSQNVSAALAVQLTRLLPQAGWGMGAGGLPPGGALNADLVLLAQAQFSGISMSGQAVPITSTLGSGNAVIWDSAISGTVRCFALLAPAEGGLLLLGPVACANASGWHSLAWPAPAVLVPAEVLPSATFSVLKADCSPYAAIPGGQGAAQVSLNGSTGGSVEVCLPNVPN